VGGRTAPGQDAANSKDSLPLASRGFRVVKMRSIRSILIGGRPRSPGGK
jgi:hypothetical protein